jgi:uncharacterized protein YjbI with pentapeptide repeats
MNGKPRVTVVLKATFGMAPGGNARLIAPLPLVTEDRGPDGLGPLVEATELAPYLPSAGVLLTGHACAPHAVPALTARLAIFRDRPLIEKSLHVFGDRAPGAASGRPFTQMPFAYERSYGGPGFEDNPVGTGAVEGGRALPNLLDPAHSQRPASFGPVSRWWGPRRRLLGARAAEAVSGANADIPDGFDWRYFHAAPADQQCEFLQGDEWIVLDGMHPTLPRLQTRLPSVRAQALWLAAGATSYAEGRPVQLVADTLLIDADRQICSLLWRGSFAVEHLDALQGAQILAGLEMPGYPMAWPDVRPIPPPSSRPVEEPAAIVRPALPFTEAPPGDRGPRFPAPVRAPAPRMNLGGTVDGSLISPFARALPFASSVAAPPLAPSVARAPDASWSVLADADDDDEQQHTRTLDVEELRAHGRRPVAPFALPAPGSRDAAPMAAIPGAPWSPQAAAPPSLVDPDLETSEMRAVEPPSFVTPPPPSLVAMDPVEEPTIPIRTRAIATPTPIPTPIPIPIPAPIPIPIVAAPASEPPSVAAPPPMPERDAEPGSALRAAVVARIQAREPIHDLHLVGADLHDVDFSGVQLARINLEGAQLLRCRFENARLADAQLDDADLTDANLAGADLSRADLRRAQLARARFDGATLSDAKLTSAQGAGASFADVKATRAVFALGQWDGATFHRAELTGADFSGASLAGARLDGAILIEANLTDAVGPGAVFDDARLPQVRSDGAAFVGASFLRADAAGSVWEKAVLDDASFAGANLKDANLARASCLRVSFAGGDLGGANLQRLTADGADFQDARLEGADLRQARLQGATLDRAGMRNVSAGKADFSRCRFVNADLQGMNLRGARLTGASLVRATLEGADLRDADLQGANVFGAARKTAKLSADPRGLIDVDPDAPKP